jgi:hypothetical protein
MQTQPACRFVATTGDFRSGVDLIDRVHRAWFHRDAFCVALCSRLLPIRVCALFTRANPSSSRIHTNGGAGFYAGTFNI